MDKNQYNILRVEPLPRRVYVKMYRRQDYPGDDTYIPTEKECYITTPPESLANVIAIMDIPEVNAQRIVTIPLLGDRIDLPMLHKGKNVMPRVYWIHRNVDALWRDIMKAKDV